MSARGRIFWALLVAVLAAALPAGASAHAYLIKTVPAASGVLNAPPPNVQLTYDEAVEPRLALISVTDVSGAQETTGSPRRSPGDPATLTVPLRPNLPQGWYLIYWRAISVDGHPVQGAFTYAVGPNPGPAPQFPVPKVSATAVTPPLLIARWAMFLSLMTAIGLLAFRLVIARPLARRSRPDEDTEAARRSLRTVTKAYVIAGVATLVAIPVYLDISLANDSLHSVFDLGANVPLFRVTAFGRAIVDLELCFALFFMAGLLALWVDRPDRRQRSLAELAAGLGAALAAAGVALIPAAAGHAAQTSPRGLTSVLDWLHLTAGSLWLGGLVGLLLLWARLPGGERLSGLRTVVPRFSKLGLGSVIALSLTGTGETIDHMPALSALWRTGFGVAILVKTGLLLLAVGLASGNLLRTTPALASGDQKRGTPAAGLLRRLVRGEVTVVAALIFVSALLTSLAPPPPAFALQDSALASVGPGRVARTVQHGRYQLQVLVSPNRAAAPDDFYLRITESGQPVRGANVTLALNHTEMEMPQQQYQLSETTPGVYGRAHNSALVMVGRWALDFQIAPPGGAPFSALILDEAEG